MRQNYNTVSGQQKSAVDLKIQAVWQERKEVLLFLRFLPGENPLHLPEWNILHRAVPPPARSDYIQVVVFLTAGREYCQRNLSVLLRLRCLGHRYKKCGQGRFLQDGYLSESARISAGYPDLHFPAVRERFFLNTRAFMKMLFYIVYAALMKSKLPARVCLKICFLQSVCPTLREILPELGLYSWD